MDAQYLKDNVYAAVTEALASMAVALPDDKVEYIGKYLLNYVERKRVHSDANAALELVLSQEKKELENIALSQVQFKLPNPSSSVQLLNMHVSNVQSKSLCDNTS